MAQDVPVQIRTMTRAEVDLAVTWAAAEGWNPGRYDSECFYKTDPGAFLLAEENGVPVGCVSSVIYDDTYSFVGFFIVLPEHRHKGVGIALGLAALQRAAGRIIGIDGVVEQQENYKKSGFVIAYNNIRYEGTGRASAGAALTPLSEIALDELVAYDTRFFPVPRRTFLECWTSAPESRGYAVLENGQLAGYGVIRPCMSGFKIGPLFADNAEIAESLYLALAAHAPGVPLYLDVPQVNAEAVALAERHGMKQVFSTARMYLNGSPNIDINGIFGVTTFELG